MAGRIEAWRRQQEVRARERASRFRALDRQLREVAETREIPRAAKAPMPVAGTLPPGVAALVDDGQVRRAVTLLANLTGASEHDARRAVSAYRRAHPTR